MELLGIISVCQLPGELLQERDHVKRKFAATAAREAAHAQRHQISWTGAKKALGDPTQVLKFLASQQLSLRERARVWWETSRAGWLWELLIAILGLTSAATFAFEAYWPASTVTLELALAGVFALDVIFHVWLYGWNWQFALLSWSVWPLLYLPISLANHEHPIFFNFLRVVRVIPAARVIRAKWKTSPLLSLWRSDVAVQATKLAYTMFCLLFCSACLFYLVEKNTGNPDVPSHITGTWPWALHECFYFIVVTFMTVGFGDYSPTSTWSLAVVLCLIVLGILLVPLQINKLLELQANRQRYRDTYTSTVPHSIVCGGVTTEKLIEFVLEWFSKVGSHNQATRLIVMGADDPTGDMEKLLNETFFQGRLLYVRGRALQPEDLDIAAVERASAVFVMAPEDIPSTTEADSATILRILAIRKKNASVPIYAMLLHSTHKAYLNRLHNVTPICSMHELSKSVIAMNCIAPGFIAYVSGVISCPIECKITKQWEREYTAGRRNEMSILKVPAEFDGMKFRAMAREYYQQFQVLLFAVRIRAEELVNDGPPTVLFPPDYRLSTGQHIWAVGTLEQLQRARHQVNDSVLKGFEKASRPTHRTMSLSTRKLLLDEDEDDEEEEPEQEFTSEPATATAPTPTGTIRSDAKTPTQLEEDLEVEKTALDVEREEYLYKLKTVVGTVDPEAERVKRLKAITKWNLAGLRHHIVVTGEFTDVEHWLRTVRHPFYTNNAPLVPIVMVGESTTPPPQLASVSDLRQVYYMAGDLMTDVDANRAGLDQASRFVVLRSGRRGQEDLLSDWHSLMPVLRLQGMGQFQLVTELRHLQNAQFLTATEVAITTPADLVMSPAFAAGQIYFTGYLDRLLPVPFFETHIIEAVEALCYPSHHRLIAETANSNITYMPLPAVFTSNVTFGEVFEYMLGREILPVAIVRAAKTRDNEDQYVITLPQPPEAEVFPTDWFIVCALEHYVDDDDMGQNQSFSTDEEMEALVERVLVSKKRQQELNRDSRSKATQRARAAKRRVKPPTFRFPLLEFVSQRKEQ